MADKYTTESCVRCGGSGVWQGWSGYGVMKGPCYRCHGVGTIQVNLSAQARRQTAAKRAAERAVANWEAFTQAEPELAAEIESAGFAGFLGRMKETVCKYGKLSEKQLDTARRVALQNKEKREARAASQAERDAKNAASQFQGTVGERTTLQLKVEKVIGFDTQFGHTLIHIMRDQSLNVYVWKTGSGNITEGSTVELTGTIKKHEEYKGVKQTILSRCKVKAEASAPETLPVAV